MTEQRLQTGDALLVVDVQNDFCPGGALAVPEGDQVVPVLNRWIHAAKDAGVPVIASRDWHPVSHVSFRERGGPWPPHCIQDTDGARFHPGLELPGDVVLVSKGTAFDHDSYSAFDATGLNSYLQQQGIRRLWVGGLAEDVCVLETVKDARALGYETHLITDATRPVETDKEEQVLETMRRSGAILEHGEA